MEAHEWKVIGPILAAVVGLYAWFIRHATGGSRHPKAGDLVYNDVCIERGKANDAEHHHLKEGIDELKIDVKDGFDRVEALIRAKK